MQAERKYIWKSKIADMVEMLSVRKDDHYVVTSHITGELKNVPTNILYTMDIDGDWNLCSLSIRAVARPEQLLMLQKDEHGQWHHGDRILSSEFDSCIDVDFSLTPFTNSLPINRLRLGTGLMREINVIYIRWPELSLQPLRQRYTNMGNELYKYENLESGYSALLSMDRDGLVMDYPGMWKRVYPVDPRAQPRD